MKIDAKKLMKALERVLFVALILWDVALAIIELTHPWLASPPLTWLLLLAGLMLLSIVIVDIIRERKPVYRHCSNCGAQVPIKEMGKDPMGRDICCPHCVFNPLGCRCKYGEYGVAETYRDPDFPEFGPWEDDVDEYDNLDDTIDVTGEMMDIAWDLIDEPTPEDEQE